MTRSPSTTCPSDKSLDALRFDFGSNWARYLEELDDERVRHAEESLSDMLETPTLRGKSFLDAGCGSGLFSLAARRLGADVFSFDCNSTSVACAEEVKRRYMPADEAWTISRGSVLDEAFLATLPEFDVVYCWGVLHHTGAMWDALGKVAAKVRPGGRLFVAIYNDQGRASRMWLRVKRAHNAMPAGLKWLVLWPAFARLWGPTFVRDSLSGSPLRTWKAYSRSGRGMSPWRDVVDWAGGYPFEVARPEQVFDYCRTKGFLLCRLRTQAGGLGCNEFVFVRVTDGAGCSAD